MGLDYIYFDWRLDLLSKTLFQQQLNCRGQNIFDVLTSRGLETYPGILSKIIMYSHNSYVHPPYNRYKYRVQPLMPLFNILLLLHRHPSIVLENSSAFFLVVHCDHRMRMHSSLLATMHDTFDNTLISELPLLTIMFWISDAERIPECFLPQCWTPNSRDNERFAEILTLICN